MTLNLTFNKWRLYVRQIHWITAAVSALCLFLYACSGFILNNDDLFASKPVTAHVSKALTEPLASQLAGLQPDAPLPAATATALGQLFSIDTRYATVRQSKGKTTLTIPEPGKRLTIEADTKAGALSFDRSDRGPVAFLTDLHKGKNVRPAWHWFINIFAISVLLFTISGFVLLTLQARSRKITWPLIGLGLALPAIFLIVLMHL